MQLTNGQQLLYEYLADGMPKHKEDIAEHLGGIQLDSLKVFVCNMNKRLANHRKRIISVRRNNSMNYQMIRLFSIDE